MAIEAIVFLAPFNAPNSRGVAATFVVPPRMGESVQLRLGGFADDVIGKVQKIIHATDLDTKKPVFYVVVERGDL